MATITRKVPDLTKLPRIGLNNLKDLPGARKAVSHRFHTFSCRQNHRNAEKDVVQARSAARLVVEAIRARDSEVESQE